MMYLAIPCLLIAALYLIALRCRNGHSAWGKLRLYRYAHRGLHHKPTIPENSMAAFRRAVEQGYGMELDVHLMRDGHLAVIHDASLHRTAGADVLIEDLTAEELSRYRLEDSDEPIPLLEDVLALCAGKVPLIVELKSERGNYNALTAATMAVLERYDVDYCVESFDPRCLLWLKKHRPEVVRGQLSQQFHRHPGDGDGQSKAVLWLLSNLLTNIATCPDFIAYRYEDRNTPSVALCRALYGVQEVNWTITDPQDMVAAESKGNLVIFERFDPKEDKE